MTCQMRMSLGVYVLGAADAGERLRVEAHLPGCRACRAELARLAPLPSLLADVPDNMLAAGQPPGHEASQPTPGTGQAARGRGRRFPARPRRAAAVAACTAAVVGTAAGAAGGFWLAPTGAGRPPATITLSGSNPGRHISATAALTATSWGTSIQLRLSGLPLNVQCRLIVRSQAGATEVSGIWDAWRNGPISVPASAAWRPSDIASLQVTTGREELVTISGARGPAPAGAASGPGRAP